MTFAGIFGGTMSAFTFPGLFAIYADYGKNIYQKMGLYAFTYGMTIVGIVGTYYSIIAFKEDN